MLRCSEPVVVLTGVTSAVTVTASASVPTSSTNLPRSRVSPLTTSTSFNVICLKPSMETRSAYRPGGSERSRKIPWSLEIADRTNPVAGSVAVTVAPGMTPSLSETSARNNAALALRQHLCRARKQEKQE